MLVVGLCVAGVNIIASGCWAASEHIEEVDDFGYIVVTVIIEGVRRQQIRHRLIVAMTVGVRSEIKDLLVNMPAL